MDINGIIEKIEAGDMEGAKNMIEPHLESINEIHSNNRSYLMLASELGNIDLIKLLVDAGADLNKCDKSYTTALHYAVDKCQSQAVTILISLGSDVNRGDINGDTPLHFAVKYTKEHKDVVAALLQTKGNSTIEVNRQNYSLCWTPLHYASALGHRDSVHLLLNHTGINVNIKSNYCHTPLHLAFEKGHYDVVTLLLSQDSVQLDIKGYWRRTPFLYAVRQGHLGIINKLIARGVEINAVDSDGENCLFSALRRDAFHSENEHIALLDKCCTELKRSKDNRLSGMVVACYLSRKGADFYQKNDKNITPLDCITNKVLKEKLQTFLQSRCMFCEVNEATVEFQPCAHNVVCEECYTIKLRRCPKCKTYIKSPRVFENLKLVNKQVQAAVPTSERKALQVETPKCVKEVLTTSQQIESPILKEKDLLRVAQKVGNKWWQVAIFLETDTTELELNCDSNDTVKLGYLMLHKWFKSCDPETRTLETLRAALEEAECSTALQYLSLDAK